MPADLQTVVQRMVEAGEPEDNIRLVIEHYGQAPPKATPPPASATIGMLQPSTAQGDPRGVGMTEAAWAALPTSEKARNVLQWGGKAIAGMFGMNAPGIINPGVEAVENPTTTLVTAAAPVVAQKALQAVPGVVEAGKRLGGISKVRAGANIQAAEQAARGVPLNTEQVGAAGLRALDLKATGGRLPQVVSKLMQRITDPGAADLTFEEARDFYSNVSRLSANEFGTLNPTMQRQVGMVKEALHQALVDAAGTVGKGEQYASGISEYAKAGRAAANWEAAKPVLRRTLLRALGAAGLGGAAKAGYDLMP